MDEGQMGFGLALAFILGVIIIVVANVATGSKCRSEAMAAGMKSEEVRQACRL